MRQEFTVAETKKLIKRLERTIKQIEPGHGTSISTAKKLAAQLYRDNGQGMTLGTKVVDNRFVFVCSGIDQYHLALDVSTEDHILGHWEEFCELRGVRPNPAIGDTVDFPSKSSPTGRRFGRITKIGPRRATVSYKFANGKRAEANVPYEKLVF